MKSIIFLSYTVAFIAVSTCEDVPCITPKNLTGTCVPPEKCSNLYAAKQLQLSLPTPLENFNQNFACELSPTAMGVCCAVEKIFELPSKCGITSSSRIANGNTTAVFEFPWITLLMYRNLDSDELEGNCGGSLISERYVITAAHCLTTESRGRRDQRNLEFVRLGEHTISTNPDCINYTDPSGYFEQDCAGPVEDIRIESYIVHPDYRKAFAGDDLGLIRLAEKIVFKAHIVPICLPMSQQLKETLLPQYFVAGWGYTESLQKSDVLLKAVLPRVDRSECQKRFDPYKKKYNITISERQICAGSEKLVDSCAGDSGGPLMWLTDYVAEPPRYVLFGVVSYGVQSCGTMDFPGVYARVGSYLEWILDIMVA